MDCATQMVKYCLFLFNTLACVAGVYCIFMSVEFLQRFDLVNQYGASPLAIFPMLIIIISSIVVLITFMGCCGAVCESTSSLKCYGGIMLLMLISQFLLVITVVFFQPELSNFIDEFLNAAWKDDDQRIFQTVQATFKCCGKNGSLDYVKIVLPETCCPVGEICTPLNSYKGCSSKIHEFVTVNNEQFKYWGIGLVVVELLGFIFSCTVASNIRSKHNRRLQAYS